MEVFASIPRYWGLEHGLPPGFDLMNPGDEPHVYSTVHTSIAHQSNISLSPVLPSHLQHPLDLHLHPSLLKHLPCLSTGSRSNATVMYTNHTVHIIIS
jgi:hypothetical protein